MNKILSLWIAALTGGAAALAQTNLPLAPEQKGTPKIQFASTTFNFGRANSGEVVKHDFVFTNSGTATLELIDVKPRCGCTTAGARDKKVEPGKTGTIPLQFNSTGYGGQVGKSAVVTCNDPGRSSVVLQVTGTVQVTGPVRKPIDITPGMAVFTLSSENPTNETKVLRIVNNLDEPITLSDLQVTNASFKTALREVKAGKEFELLVTPVPPFTSPTVFSTITLKTSTTNAPILRLTAYATVQPPVAVLPQQVTLPAGPLKTPLSAAVFVFNNGTNTLALSDVRLDLSGVEVKVTEPKAGRLYSISLTFPAGFQLEAGQKPELTFKSSHPRYPVIKVPLVQTQPTPAAPARAPAAAPG